MYMYEILKENAELTKLHVHKLCTDTDMVTYMYRYGNLHEGVGDVERRLLRAILSC